MWQGLFTLLSFSSVMGIASFLAGSLPLSFSLSQNHSRIISAIGTGLLVGTCLIIIIPEGIETLYSSASVAHQDPTSLSPSGTEAGSLEDPSRSVRRQAEGAGGETHPGTEPHTWIGISLISGFIMMYLIDQLPRLAWRFSPRRPLHISLANLSQGPHRVTSPRHSIDGDALEEYGEGTIAAKPKSSATTIGLVIHAAADGIALAASSFVAQASTGFIVFLALMIHKAPAAFGLTSVLLKQGRTKRQTRAHLIVFSLAAPVAAIATWVLVNMFGSDDVRTGQGTEFATGLLLLFSGGTFLYVAMHTMQENTVEGQEEGPHAPGNGHAYGQLRGPGKARERPPDVRDALLVVMGMLLPLLAQIGHAH